MKQVGKAEYEPLGVLGVKAAIRGGQYLYLKHSERQAWGRIGGRWQVPCGKLGGGEVLQNHPSLRLGANEGEGEPPASQEFSPPVYYATKEKRELPT